MKKRYIVAASSFFLFGIVVVASIWSSSWVLWYLITSTTPITVVVVDESLAGPVKSKISIIKDPFQDSSQNISQYALVKRENALMVVARPYIGKKAKLINQLQSDQWKIVNTGILIEAVKGGNESVSTVELSLSRYAQAFLSSTVKLLKDPKGFYPIVISSLLPGGSFLPTEEPLYVIAEKNNGSIEIKGVLGDDESVENISKTIIRKKALSQVSNNLSFSLQSRLIPLIPENLKKSLNNQLMKALGFVHKKTNLISSLERTQGIRFATSEQGAVLMIVGSGATLKEEIKTLVEDNDAYNYPKKHGFLLPDKVLGYEYIPGKSPVVWEKYSASCEVYKGKNSPLFICEKDSHLIISTSQSLIENQNTAFQEEWSFTAQSKDDGAAYIVGEGNDKSFRIYLY